MDRVAPDVSRGELWALTPQVIRDALPDVPWSLQRLHALDLPVVQVPVADLLWGLDLPVWQNDGRRFQVTPRQVLDDPEQFPHEASLP